LICRNRAPFDAALTVVQLPRGDFFGEQRHDEADTYFAQ